MKKIPTLVSDVVSYVVIGRNELYLAIFNNKKENVKVRKLIERGVQLKQWKLDENKVNLELRLDEDNNVEAYISSKYLPSENKYLVKNFDKSTAIRILSEAKHDDDIVFSSEFEICFTGEYNELVTFISEEQQSYQEIFDEMIRRFFAESGKKTIKWVPGHRYDNSESTFYYLGDFLSRKKCSGNSDFYNTQEELVPVHFYITRLGKEKTISEVIKNRSIGEADDDIKVLWGNFPRCIDSGQKLELGEKISLSSLYPGLMGNDNPLLALGFLSEGDKLEFTDYVKSKILNWTIDKLKEIIYNYWNLKFGDFNSSGENITLISEEFYNDLSKTDPNICSKTYYQELLNTLGVDVEKEISNILLYWNEDDLCKTYENFVNNLSYFRKRSKILDYTALLRSTDRVIKISDLFGNSLLTSTLIELIKSASNYGQGITDIKIIKINKVDTVTACVVECEDLIDYLGSSITDELKKEILDKKFTKLIVYFEKIEDLE